MGKKQMPTKGAKKSDLRQRLPALAVLAVVVGGVLVIVSRGGMFGSAPEADAVTVPDLTPLAQQGEKLFAENCASCHGVNAAGGQGGPPLVHNLYNPGHHADAAFRIAVRRGVRQHHWRFGDMPPRREVGEKDIQAITRYVRELQVANGIGN